MDKTLALLNSPVMILVLAVLFLLVFLRGTKLDFPTFVVAVNGISTQPFALSVLVIGFWMLVECKKFGIDTTIAGGVIGVASNMLQSQLKDATHVPLPPRGDRGANLPENTLSSPDINVGPPSINIPK